MTENSTSVFLLVEFCSPHHCHDLLNKCPWEAKGSWTNLHHQHQCLFKLHNQRKNVQWQVFSNFPYICRPRKALVPQKHFWNILCVKKNNITDFKILKLMVRTKLRSLVIFFQITDYPSISNSFFRSLIFILNYIRLRECRFQRTKHTQKKITQHLNIFHLSTRK